MNTNSIEERLAYVEGFAQGGQQVIRRMVEMTQAITEDVLRTVIEEKATIEKSLNGAENETEGVNDGE